MAARRRGKITLRPNSARNCASFCYGESDRQRRLDSEHVSKVGNRLCSRERTTRENQYVSRAVGNIADVQLRRQPKEKNDGVPEPTNGRGGRPERRKGERCERERLAGDGREQRSASALRVGVFAPFPMERARLKVVRVFAKCLFFTI